MTQIFQDTPADIQRVAEILAGGGVVALPTETVYGLAANAFDRSACGAIFELKERPLNDPLIVHVANGNDVVRVAAMNSLAKALGEIFWPGPLTMVLAKNPSVPDIVTAGLSSVAVRVPRHPVLRKVLEASGLAVAAPSANPFGYVSPTRVEHIVQTFGDKLDHILDGGPCEIGLESTVLDLRDPRQPVILRPGAVSQERIDAALGGSAGVACRSMHRDVAEGSGLPSPGLSERHYSTNTPLLILDPLTCATLHKTGEDLTNRWAAVLFRKDLHRAAEIREIGATEVSWLSETGNSDEAARTLFDLLQSLDNRGFDVIYAETAPPGGLGAAINDRLARAASGRRWVSGK